MLKRTVYLLFSLIVVLSMALASCAPGATPTQAPAATVAPVATQAPAATVAPAATQAPAATVAPVSTQAPAATKAPAATNNATLTYAVSADAKSLDPSKASGRLDVSIVYSIVDLLAIRDNQGVSQPYVAESWTRVDPLTWEIKIRKGITFTNGEPLNAAAVKFTMERARIPEFNNNYQLPVQTKLKEVKIIDDYTVQFITEVPSNTMEYWLAESPIFPPKYYGENSIEAVAKKPIGSGPYKFVEWVKDDHITLERNDAYWGPKPAYKTIVFRVIPEVSARINELVAGNIDVASALSLDQASQANSAVSSAEYVVGLRKMHFGIAQNSANKALKDKRVRQALNYAVDKEALVTDLMGGKTDILKSYVNLPNNNPDLKPYTYNPEKAKALLAEAGYSKGFDVVIQGRASAYGFDKEIMTAVAANLKAVGVNATVEVMENGAYLDALDKKKLAGLNWHGWAALINPTVENLILTCGHVDNAVDYCNPEFDKLYNQMLTEPDAAKRQDLNFKMQAIAWDDAPWIYLWHLPMVYGVSKHVDYKPRPDGYIFLWEAKTK